VVRAAERASAADLSRMRGLADQMAEAIRFDDAERIAGPDVLFHREIVTISGNKRLLAAWDPIGGLVSTFLSITNTTWRDLPESLASHYRLIEMIQAGDGAAAAEALRKHLGNGEQVMRSALQSRSAEVFALNGRAKE
jgi:DNA-binding FadR family transcriptional regulator